MPAKEIAASLFGDVARLSVRSLGFPVPLATKPVALGPGKAQPNKRFELPAACGFGFIVAAHLKSWYASRWPPPQLKHDVRQSAGGLWSGSVEN